MKSVYFLGWEKSHMVSDNNVYGGSCYYDYYFSFYLKTKNKLLHPKIRLRVEFSENLEVYGKKQ